MVVAIDGPSGSGKSSTARGVALALGYAYLDTGAMYRAVATEFLVQGVAPGDADAIARITRDADLRISTDPADQWVRINGRDVTTRIREPEVSAVVSAVATNPACRAELVRRQQGIIATAAPGIVAEGRDITTVVAPDAAVRLLLVADPQARVARRAAELGDGVSADDVTDQVIRRDRDDSRLVEFQKPAPGVDLLDSTYLSLDEVVADIVARVRAVV
ncbi:(d)CMP kinase [Propionicicella superfundia]|uniref:(d)CMP kinase n=1 Tax=Propionicicella superfundia TaxID=348582 RepID=UPI0004903EED